MNRRDFVKQGLAGIAAFTPSLAGVGRSTVSPLGKKEAVGGGAPKPIKVTVWDERQPAQKEAYENFLGNAIADHLRTNSGLAVKSVGLDDPDQGLPLSVLDDTDVLIWWGHQRHGDVKDELVREIVTRVMAGKLALLALHSAHWSKPFTSCMDERAVADALKSLPVSERAAAHVERIPGDRRIMERNEKLTPYFTRETGPDGKLLLKVKLPSCVFPFVANEGKPSHIKTLVTSHPIAKGVPAAWEVPQTEVYGGPFHVPSPDVTLFDERWDNGESFPSGSLWRVGKGQVFYFRPGHETYPIYKQPVPRTIVENAVRWLAAHKKG